MAALLSSFLEAGVLENSNVYLLDKLSLGVSAHLPCLLCESDDYKWKKMSFTFEALPNRIWLGQNSINISLTFYLFYLKSDFF